MIPLFYFASQGTLWFQKAAANNSADNGGFGRLAGAGSRENIAIAMAVFAFALMPMSQKLRGLCKSAIKNKAISALVLLAMASCVWSQFPDASIKWSLCLAMNTLFAFYIYQRFDPGRQTKLMLLLGWICLVTSYIAVLFFPQFGLNLSSAKGAWEGIYIQKNLCSIMTVFLLSAAFYDRTTTFLSKGLRATYVCMSILFVLMTQSKTGLVLLSGLLVYVIVTRFAMSLRARDKAVTIIIGMTCFVIISVVGFLYSAEISFFLGKDPTLTGRTGIWQSAVMSIMKRPVAGYGYMAFWRGLQGESANASLANGWAVSSTHNGFLAIWLTLGALGLGLVLYSLLKSLKNSLLCMRAGNSPHLNWYACIVFLTIIVSLDEEQMMVPNDLTWILYILASVGLAEGARRIRLGSNHG
jgi:O-antigen ligase